jgi:CheY-like chemotaxis protein
LALNSSGYRTLEAGNGGEALLAVEGHNGPIDLMLTDVVMPGMTGKELVERLKQLRPEMKVLYMSGYSGDEMIRRGLLEAGDVHIAKPFSPDSLSGKVREILGPAKVATTVLVVDDEVGVREYFRQVLVDAGYQVLLAGDGEEAMTIAKSQPVQAVLMDLVMPGQEGLETIQALRQQVPGARVIAVSGGFGGQFLGVARMLGADATMSKPVSPDELLSKLAGVLAPKTA